MELYLEPDIVYERKQRDKGRFKKGYRPWNKGLKGLNMGGEKTWFKKGHEPHNTKYDGCIAVRHHKRTNERYKYIRVAKGKWVLYHRYIYEKEYGAIPKGYIIRFKDGDTMNCTLENLECISRRENMERNRNVEKAAESMRRRWASEKRRAAYGLSLETKLLKRIKR